MPIYEYVCLNCKHEFEAIRPMGKADQPMACAKCGGEEIKRKISVFYAESGGKAVSGMSGPGCEGCAGGSCAHCGH
jgi:putative FmdB family regulatory protein